MSSDLDPWESDTRDEAESYVLLDDGEVRAAVCAQCNRMFCVCCPRCGIYGCPCDRDAAFFDGPLYRGRAGGRTKR